MAADSYVDVVEYAHMMSGGGMHVRYMDQEIERIFPLADWIRAQQRFGGKVYRREIRVIEDWTEVPPAPRDVARPGTGPAAGQQLT